MYMYMRIVITMNIYIRPDLEKRLRQESSMSGLINNLLERHYFDTVDGGKTQEQVHAKIRNTQKAVAETEEVDIPDANESWLENLIFDTINQAIWDTSTGEPVDADPGLIKELKKRGQVK